jgi:hypothetical protein
MTLLSAILFSLAAADKLYCIAGDIKISLIKT